MRHKLGVVILAAVMTIAGTREAFRQFGELKSSVTDWTRTSILGNLLVFAGTAEGSDAQPQTVLVAQSYTACKGERSPAAVQPSRPASKTKANAEHAKIEKSENADTLEARGLDDLAHSLAAARDAKSRGELIVKLAPQVSEIAKTFGAEFDEQMAETAFRARESGGATARARAAAELKKLGVRKVFVRVAKTEGAERYDYSFKALAPENVVGALELKPISEVRGVTTQFLRPSDPAPAGVALPAEQSGPNCFFSAPSPCNSPDCDPLVY